MRIIASSTEHMPIAGWCDECGHRPARHITEGRDRVDVRMLCGPCKLADGTKRRVVREGVPA